MIILPHRDYVQTPSPLWTPPRGVLPWRRPPLQRYADPIQTANNNSAATTALVVTLGANAQIGDTLFASVLSNNSGVTSITGGGAGVGADAWATTVVLSNFNASLELWKCVVTGTPGTAITINTPSARICALVHQHEGRYTLDKSGATGGTSVTPLTSSITPLFPTEVVFALDGQFNTISAGPTGAYTSIGSALSGTFQLNVAMLRQGTPAATSTSWTIASAPWDTIIESFRTQPYINGAQVDELTDSIATA